MDNPFFGLWSDYEWDEQLDFEEADAEDEIARREYNDYFPSQPMEI